MPERLVRDEDAGDTPARDWAQAGGKVLEQVMAPEAERTGSVEERHGLRIDLPARLNESRRAWDVLFAQDVVVGRVDLLARVPVKGLPRLNGDLGGVRATEEGGPAVVAGRALAPDDVSAESSTRFLVLCVGEGRALIFINVPDLVLGFPGEDVGVDLVTDLAGEVEPLGGLLDANSGGRKRDFGDFGWKGGGRTLHHLGARDSIGKILFGGGSILRSTKTKTGHFATNAGRRDLRRHN